MRSIDVSDQHADVTRHSNNPVPQANSSPYTIQALAGRTNSKILDVFRATDELARDHAIDVLTTGFRLHGLAIDRILGLPDASITVLTRDQVEAMVAALPRNY